MKQFKHLIWKSVEVQCNLSQIQSTERKYEWKPIPNIFVLSLHVTNFAVEINFANTYQIRIFPYSFLLKYV